MKISFLEPHLKLYGGIRRIIELANRLTKRGHEVTIFHSDGTPCQWMECIAQIKSREEVLINSHEIFIYNDPNRRDFFVSRRINAKLKIFYSLGLYDRNLLTEFNPRLYFLWRWSSRKALILKSCLLLPDQIVLSNATWMRNWLRDNLNLESTLLRGGINGEVFHPIPIKPYMGIVRILCSGDPRINKGLPTILEAIDRVKEAANGLEIVLDTYYGKGVPQEDMAKVYSSADIFVDAQRSISAGWNNPVAEAMACKTPVVCTDIGAVQDFAFHEKTALLVPPDDAIAVAEAILRLIKEPALRETLRENAYQHIQTFDWDRSAAELERILLMELSKKSTH